MSTYAHRMYSAAKDSYAKHDIELLYLPVTASELNPAKLIWANFKQKFRRML